VWAANCGGLGRGAAILSINNNNKHKPHHLLFILPKPACVLVFRGLAGRLARAESKVLDEAYSQPLPAPAGYCE